MTEPVETLKSEDEVSPLGLVYSAAGLAIASIILTLFIPGLVAWKDGVFHQNEVGQKVITKGLIPGIPKCLIYEQIITDNKYKKYKEKLSDVTISGFYLGRSMLVYPAVYTTLGWLVFLVPPFEKQLWSKRRILRTMAIALGIYVFYRWPTYLLYLVLSDFKHGRRLYSSYNPDISRVSFCVQELMVLGFCGYLTALWQQWTSFINLQHKILRPLSQPTCNYKDAALDPRNSTMVSTLFLHWQIASVILGLAYVSYTYLVWNNIIGKSDDRFLPTVILLQILWFITWSLISYPFLETLYTWHSIHMHTIIDSINNLSQPDNDSENFVKLLLEIKPLGFWNVAASGVFRRVAPHTQLAETEVTEPV